MNKSIDVTIQPCPETESPDREILNKKLESEDLYTLPIDDLITYIEGGKKKNKKTKQRTPPTSVSPENQEFTELDKEIDEFRQRIDIPPSPERLRVNFSEDFIQKLRLYLENNKNQISLIE